MEYISLRELFIQAKHTRVVCAKCSVLQRVGNESLSRCALVVNERELEITDSDRFIRTKSFVQTTDF